MVSCRFLYGGISMISAGSYHTRVNDAKEYGKWNRNNSFLSHAIAYHRNELQMHPDITSHPSSSVVHVNSSHVIKSAH